MICEMNIFLLLFYKIILLSIAECIAVEARSAMNISTSTTQSTIQFAPLWIPRTFTITCCHGAHPVPQNAHLVKNWTELKSDYVIDYVNTDGHTPTRQHANRNTGDSTSHVISDTDNDMENNNNNKYNNEDGCVVYEGNYLLSASALFNINGINSFGVKCACEGVDGGYASTLQFDKNCRRLAACLNHGYRSYPHPVNGIAHCICPEPYFGEFCEKFCDQGQRMKGADGRDYCGCVPFYQGEECREMVCLNGGTEMKQRCVCPPNFLGYHCEIDTNRTSATSRFQRYGDQEIIQGNELFTRDISGTIFSLIMIIVLVVSMYLLMKHRMQVQNRITTLRREDLIRSTHAATISTRRANEMLSCEDTRTILSFRAAPLYDNGPPPYVLHPNRARFRHDDRLPALPSYEDATKLPPLSRTNLVLSPVQRDESQQDSGNEQTQVVEHQSRSTVSEANEANETSPCRSTTQEREQHTAHHASSQSVCTNERRSPSCSHESKPEMESIHPKTPTPSRPQPESESISASPASGSNSPQVSTRCDDSSEVAPAPFSVEIITSETNKLDRNVKSRRSI